MRGVDHLAVQLQRAGAWVGLKGGDDGAGVGEFGFAGGKGVIDHGHLRRVDREHAGEAVAAPTRGISGEAVEVAEVGEHRLDRGNAGGMGAEQGECANDAIGIGVAAVLLTRGGRADGGGKILRAPGDAGEAAGDAAEGAELEHRRRRLAGDGEDDVIARQAIGEGVDG